MKILLVPSELFEILCTLEHLPQVIWTLYRVKECYKKVMKITTIVSMSMQFFGLFFHAWDFIASWLLFVTWGCGWVIIG
mgnify:CR=1 FL=1